MVEEQTTPDWLADLAGQQLAEDAVDIAPQEAADPLTEALQDQTAQTDMLGDLRGQVGFEEEPDHKESASPLRPVLNLQPAQRFVLALLVLLNVALCGCMALVMLERVGLPL